MAPLRSTTRRNACPPRRLGRALAVVVGCGLLWSTAGEAHPVVSVEAGTLRLVDVWPQAPSAIAEVELGPAPPAGSSRLLLRRDLVRQLAVAGVSANELSLPRAIRVQTRSERWSRERLRDETWAAASEVLPEGIVLKAVDVRAVLVLPAGTVVQELVLPRLPRRAGQVSISGVLRLQREGRGVARVPVSLVLEVSAAAATPDVGKGDTLRIYIVKGTAEITAEAEALEDGDAGQVIQCRVLATRRVVPARIEGPERARVVQR